jgi:hypothetical protein
MANFVDRRFGIVSILCLHVLMSGCTKNLTKRTEVYFNDFETRNTNEILIANANGLIDNQRFLFFNGSLVYGNFNSNYVLVTVPNVPKHNIVQVEFDLYTHDNWRGNEILPGFTEPDKWLLMVDQAAAMITTFSNTPGLNASFPDNYSAGINPYPARGNSWNFHLQGVCSQQSNTQGTTLYKVQKIYPHESGTLKIAFTDNLQIKNNLCDKSWSIDNLRITVMDFASGS